MTIDILKFANSCGLRLIEMQILSKVPAILRRWWRTTLREAALPDVMGKKLENAPVELDLVPGGGL